MADSDMDGPFELDSSSIIELRRLLVSPTPDDPAAPPPEVVTGTHRCRTERRELLKQHFDGEAKR